jgi:hypothetical protein
MQTDEANVVSYPSGYRGLDAFYSGNASLILMYKS